MQSVSDDDVRKRLVEIHRKAKALVMSMLNRVALAAYENCRNCANRSMSDVVGQ